MLSWPQFLPRHIEAGRQAGRQAPGAPPNSPPPALSLSPSLHRAGRASCHVVGDPHYYTFDRVMHTFLGGCTYTLVTVCSHNSSVTPVTISGKNEDRGQSGATFLREVYVDVHGTRITLQKDRRALVRRGAWVGLGAPCIQASRLPPGLWLVGRGARPECRSLEPGSWEGEAAFPWQSRGPTLTGRACLQLNGERVYTPLESRSRGLVTVGNVGAFLVVETDFGLMVKYDGNQYLEISLPSSYSDQVRRVVLCVCGGEGGSRPSVPALLWPEPQVVVGPTLPEGGHQPILPGPSGGPAGPAPSGQGGRGQAQDAGQASPPPLRDAAVHSGGAGGEAPSPQGGKSRSWRVAEGAWLLLGPPSGLRPG